jgi:putative radical SAM enzyme (TIGR03279 family)
MSREKSMPLVINHIEPDSTAFEVGILVDDKVVSVNEQIVRDPLEWRYLIADDYVEIEIARKDELFIFEIEKDFDDALGIHLKGPGFKRCNNRCVFCFIDQNPRGVRKPLKFKDEDFRLSFLFGNYVTLTNTPKEDLDRIIEQRLSPIYVSVHATETELRRKLLGNAKAPDVLPIMQYLADGRIMQHAQIVLMPDLNDAEHLDRTLNDLAELHPWIGSVCIVPVGLTRHREKLPDLRPHTPDEALNLIRWQTQQHERFLRDIGERFVYIADEFYLLADVDLPQLGFYEGFPQIGNGVGMVRQFIDNFDDGFSEFVKNVSAESIDIRIDVITATLPAQFISEMTQRINDAVPGVQVTPRVLTNSWYGEGITVSGLLVGRDIVAECESVTDSDVVLLPPNCVNDDMLFLDDMHIEELQEQIGKPVVLGNYDLTESIRMAIDRFTTPPESNSSWVQTDIAPISDDDDSPAETMRAM